MLGGTDRSQAPHEAMPRIHEIGPSPRLELVRAAHEYVTGRPEVSLKILLFGNLGETFGREVTGDVPPEGCSIAQLRQMLVKSNPSFEPLARPSIRAAVDQVIVAEDFIVRPGQELAFLPPLSGG